MKATVFLDLNERETPHAVAEVLYDHTVALRLGSLTLTGSRETLAEMERALRKFFQEHEQALKEVA